MTTTLQTTHGRPLTTKERHNRSIQHLIAQLSMFIRKDFGGRDPLESIKLKCSELGWKINNNQAQIIVNLIDAQLKACRIRQKPILNEITERFGSITELINGQ